MGSSMLNIVVISMAYMGFIVGAHVFKDYKNKEVVLTSVYDAMKNNLQRDIRNNLNRNDVLHDSRNKRNTNLNEYYDNVPSESMNDWAVINGPSPGPTTGYAAYPSGDLVCTKRGDHSQTRITVNDHHAAGISIALLIKYGLILLAALSLPIFIFKVFIVPFKILLGLKAISLLNSLLLGSLLLKYKFSKPLYYASSSGQPIPGTIPGQSSSSSSASAGSSTGSAEMTPFELQNDNSDYVDVIRPGEDLRRILKYVRRRNKKW